MGKGVWAGGRGGVQGKGVKHVEGIQHSQKPQQGYTGASCGYPAT